MKRLYEKYEIEEMWMTLEITLFDDMGGWLCIAPVTKEEFSVWSDEEVIWLFEKIYAQFMRSVPLERLMVALKKL